MLKKLFKKMAIVLVGGSMAFSMLLSGVYAADQPNVTVDMEKSGLKEELDRFEIYLTINETAEGNIKLDLSDAILKVLDAYAKAYNYNSYPILPGDSNHIKVYITNNSNHTYMYSDQSFELTTADYNGLQLSEYVGYDGKLLPSTYIAGIPASHKAIYNHLFGVKRSSQVTAEMMFTIYDYLENKGYTGQDALTRYMVDYYNDFYKTNYSSFAELATNMPNLGDTFARAGSNSLFKMDYLTMKKYCEENPKVADSIYYIVKDDKGTEDINDDFVEVQIKWTEEELAVFSYDVFYNNYFSFAYGEETADLNPNKNTAFTRTRAVGDYRQHDLYEQTNHYFKTLENADSFENGEEISFDMKLAIDGPGVGNGYMLYDFTFYNAIALQQVDTTYTVEHQYYTSVDGGDYTLDGTVLTELVNGLVDDVISVEDIEKLVAYDGQTYEYHQDSGDLILVLDPKRNKIIIEYRRDTRSSTSYTVEHRYYTSVDGGDYVLDGTVLGDSIEGLVGDEIRAEDIEKVLGYGEGTYELYNGGEDIVLVVDKEANKIVIEYRRDVTTPDEDEVLGDKEEPEVPVVETPNEDEVLGDTGKPDTSDTDAMNMFAMTMMLGAMGFVALKKRKES